jgi:hypothetical protein
VLEYRHGTRIDTAQAAKFAKRGKEPVNFCENFFNDCYRAPLRRAEKWCYVDCDVPLASVSDSGGKVAHGLASGVIRGDLADTKDLHWRGHSDVYAHVNIL